MKAQFISLKMSPNFIHALDQFSNFTEEEKSLICDKVRIKEIKNEAFLKDFNSKSQYIYFIVNGAFRLFYLENNIEITLNLFVDGEWCFDQSSLLTQKPNKTAIQCVENSLVYELSLYSLHELIALSQKFLRLGSLIDQIDPFRGLDPLEKYNEILQNKPTVLQKFPLKHIASFLKIRPETLSRIRRKSMDIS